MRGALFSLAGAMALLLSCPAAAQQLQYSYGALSSDVGTTNGATTQVSVTTSPIQIAGPRAGRKRVVVSLVAANDCYFGFTSSVSATTGFRVKGVDGAVVTIDTQIPIYSVCAAATTESVMELF